MAKKYISYETNQTMKKSDWHQYYTNEIDHTEYPDFDCWWHDMMKMNLLSEI